MKMHQTGGKKESYMHSENPAYVQKRWEAGVWEIFTPSQYFSNGFHF
jgi:hypothetical protein